MKAYSHLCKPDSAAPQLKRLRFEQIDAHAHGVVVGTPVTRRPYRDPSYPHTAFRT